MRHDVFISYSRSDRNLADALVHALRSRGVSVWYDQMIPAGADWREEIASNLTQSGTLIILFSGEANGSTQLRKELSLADGAGINVLPVLTEAVEPEGHYAFELAYRHWLDIHSDPEGRIGEIARLFSPDGPTPAAVSNDTPIEAQPELVRKAFDEVGPDSAESDPARPRWKVLLQHRMRTALLVSIGVGLVTFGLLLSSDAGLPANAVASLEFAALAWATIAAAMDRHMPILLKRNLLRRSAHALAITGLMSCYSVATGDFRLPQTASEIFDLIFVIVVLAVPVALVLAFIQFLAKRVSIANAQTG